MMARYFFNVFNDADTPDLEGTEYADLPSAKQAAINGARHLIAEHVLKGRTINLNHRIEVADGRGKVLAIIPYREVVTIEQ